MMLRVLLHRYFTTKPVFVSAWLETITFTAELWAAEAVWGTVWAASPLWFWQGLTMSRQVPPAGACTTRLGVKQGGKPALPPPTGTWLGAGHSREPLRQLGRAWNCILHPPALSWMENDAPYPFPSSAGREQSKAGVTGGDGWGCGGRFHCCLSVLGLEHSLLNLIQWSRVEWSILPSRNRLGARTSLPQNVLPWDAEVNAECESSPRHRSQESVPGEQGGGQAAQEAL